MTIQEAASKDENDKTEIPLCAISEVSFLSKYVFHRERDPRSSFPRHQVDIGIRISPTGGRVIVNFLVCKNAATSLSGFFLKKEERGEEIGNFQLFCIRIRALKSLKFYSVHRI